MAPHSRRQFPNSEIHSLLRASRDRDRHLALGVLTQSEAEESQIVRPADGTLLFVHHQTQASLDELANRIHHPTPGTRASYKYAEIVGVSHEAKTTACQLPIEFVQDDIRKERRKRAALGRAFFRGHARAVRHDHLRLEHPMYQLQETPILHPLSQTAQQALMMDTVEELRQVDVDRNRASFVQVLRCLGDGRLCTTTWSEAMAAVMKHRLKDRLQHLEHGLLNPAIDDVGNPESPLPASGLGDPYPANVTRLVSSR